MIPWAGWAGSRFCSAQLPLARVFAWPVRDLASLTQTNAGC